MKKLIALVAAVAVLAAFFALYLPHKLNAPERALVKMMDALHSGWLGRAEKHTLSGLGLDTSNRRVKKLYKAMFATMRYVVADTVEGEDTAQIVVSVTMVDMEALLAATSQDLLDKSLQGKRVDEKRYYKLLTERIRSGDAPTATNTATAYMVRGDKGWRVDLENSAGLQKAITGDAGFY